LLKVFKKQTYQNVQYLYQLYCVWNQLSRTGLIKNENDVLSGPLSLLVRPSPYRAVNTLRLGYTDQSVNVV